MRKVLTICTGMGLLDRGFHDAGFHLTHGCEIDPDMRRMHAQIMRYPKTPYLTHDLKDLPDILRGERFEGIIGGPPCQAHSRLKSFRDPKFEDATPLVLRLLEAVQCEWFLFENVVPVQIPDAYAVKLNAMHYGRPHQSRERWFVYKGLTVPRPLYKGSVDDLMAYPIVAGKTYGPKRASRLQGYPLAGDLDVPCPMLQKGLSNAVHYGLAHRWGLQARSRIPAGMAPIPSGV
jgi:hypothetical protein